MCSACAKAWRRAPGPLAILIGYGITGVGILALAFVYQGLATRKPALNAGPYAYRQSGLWRRRNENRGRSDRRLKFVDKRAREAKMKLQSFASGSLALGGLILMGLGIYFGFLRPSFLPEDLSYMGASLAQIQSAVPVLTSWLTRVFGVLGSFMFATGLLTVYVAGTGFKDGKPGAKAIVAVSGLASIGWMAITNFLIDSDFKWLLLAFTLPWLVALVLSWLGEWCLSRGG